jgi:hypothetical protein
MVFSLFPLFILSSFSGGVGEWEQQANAGSHSGRHSLHHPVRSWLRSLYFSVQKSVLRIRYVCPGSEFSPSRIQKVKKILDPVIRFKEFKYFKPNKLFLALGNMIRFAHPGSGFFTLSGSWIQGSKDTGSGSATLTAVVLIRVR